MGNPERYKMKITHDKLKRIIKEELSLISEDLFDDAVEAGDLNEDRFDDASTAGIQGFDESEVTARLDEAYDNYIDIMGKAERDIRSMHRFTIEIGPEDLLGWLHSDAFPAMREGRLPESPSTIANTRFGPFYGGLAYVGPIEENILTNRVVNAKIDVNFDPIKGVQELYDKVESNDTQRRALLLFLKSWSKDKDYVTSIKGGKGNAVSPGFSVVSYKNLPSLERRYMVYSPYDDDGQLVKDPSSEDVYKFVSGGDFEMLTEEGESLSLESLRKLYNLVKDTSEDNSLGWDV